MKKRLKANAMLILTAMIWGFAFVAQKEASAYIGSLTFIAIRFLLGGLSLIPVIFVFERSDIKDKQRFKKTILYGAATGTILFVASTLQQIGVSINEQTSKAGFITGLYTVLVPLFGIFVGKKVKFNVWIGAILAVIGLYMISIVGSPKIEFGDLLLLIGAFFWAFHILAIDKFIGDVSPIKYSCVQFLTCSVLGFILLPFFELHTFSVQNILSAGTSILYAEIMSSGVAYTLQIVAQKNADPTEAAIIFSTESVFSAIGCTLFLSEIMETNAYIGCALILAGVILSQLNINKKKLA